MRSAIVLVAWAICIGAAGCYTSSYRKELAANTDLISQLGDKLSDYCRAGFLIGNRPVSSEEMGEFYYALKKAREFSAMTASRSTLKSHRDFDAMLSKYEDFLRSGDEYRLSGARNPARLDILMRQHQAVASAAAKVHADLASEGN